MILKGSTIASASHARAFARHLFKDENEVSFVRYSYGSAIDTKSLAADLVDLHLMTQVTRGVTGIFHVAINPREREEMTEANWDQSVQMIETEFNLHEQPRIEMYHQKAGRKHIHVFWSLVDGEQEKLIQITRFKRRLQRQADLMEERFGHTRTRRMPDRNTIEITDADRMRKTRGGSDPKVRKKLIRDIWNQAPSPEQFLLTLKLHGFTVVQGERCRYAMIDHRGEIFNFVRELPKLVKLPEVSRYLGNQQLPELSKVKAQRLSHNQSVANQIERIAQKKARQRRLDREEGSKKDH